MKFKNFKGIDLSLGYSLLITNCYMSIQNYQQEPYLFTLIESLAIGQNVQAKHEICPLIFRNAFMNLFQIKSLVNHFKKKGFASV